MKLVFETGNSINYEYGLTNTSWKRLRGIIKRRDKSICQYCNNKADNGHVDHVIPLSKGGTDRLDNLVWTCQECNLKKHDKLPFVSGSPESNPRYQHRPIVWPLVAGLSEVILAKLVGHPLRLNSDLPTISVGINNDIMDWQFDPDNETFKEYLERRIERTREENRKHNEWVINKLADRKSIIWQIKQWIKEAVWPEYYKRPPLFVLRFIDEDEGTEWMQEELEHQDQDTITLPWYGGGNA